MEAQRILNGITGRMTKAQMLSEVDRALVEMELLDIHQVACQVGGKVANVRARCINNGLGQKVGKMGRVYSPGDVAALRVLIAGGEQPKTRKLRAEMARLKEAGLTNRAIAAKLEVDPSYVTKLLRIRTDE